MKNFLLLLSLFIMTLTVNAQTQTSLKLMTSNHKLFDYGNSATMTTTDSTVNTIATVSISDDEAGVLEVQAVGFNDSLGAAVTGSKIVRYVKTGGTLTLGTPTAALASATDSGLGTATWSISTSSDDIIITVKGKLGLTVNWKVNVRRMYATD